MLNDAENSAKPTKYAQNKCHGMYEGTPSMMDLASEKCSAPKTAKGAAKHKLLKATTLSRPWACAISVFAAQRAIRKSPMPAPHIETTVLGIPRNVARMTKCTGPHLFGVCFFSTFAQVSFRATVRLNTGLPGFESESTQKYPRRSN